MSQRQATKRKGAQKKASNRQNNSSNARQARASQANTRANRGLGPLISAPINSGRQNSSVNPGINMSRDGTKCRVVQRELIDVLDSPSSIIFSVRKRFRCNPGSALTFPWLSSIANSWETYKFHRLSFHSIPRCPTTTAGSVLISPDYDAQDGQPNTETQMSQMKGTQEGPPWQPINLRLDPKAMNRLYKAHVTMDDSRFETTTQDEKTIDVAQVFFGTDCDPSVKIGKIWVDYDVEFFTPQPPNLPLSLGGGSMSIGVDGSNPHSNGQGFSNLPSQTQVLQDVSNPLFSVVDNTAGGGTNLVKMLRDWTGNIDFLINYNTGAFGGGQSPPLFKNGVAIPVSATSPDSFFKGFTNGLSNPSGTGTTTGSIYEGVALKAGDLIGINPAGIQNIATTLTAVDSILRFGGNAFAYV